MTMIACAFLQSQRLKQASGGKRILGPPPQPSLPTIRQAILGRIANRAWLKGDQNLAVSRGSTLYWRVLKSPDLSPSQEHPMKFRPLQDRVLIRRIEQEEKTSGGIIIPDTAKEKPMEGEVVAAGPGARAEDGRILPLDVKVGDRVLFGKWSGTEIKLDGEDLMIMKESDLMGVIEGKTSSKHKAA
jgi:chaperonin GroES